MRIQTFACRRCGKCCKISPLTLLPHEAIVLDKLARELGLNIDISPGFTVVDHKNQVRIALSYVLNIEPSKGCVFLEDRGCRLQYVYKPLICRSFPFVPSFIRYLVDVQTKTISHLARYGLSTVCDYVKELQSQSFDPNNIPNMFPDEYEAHYIAEYLRMTYLHALTRFWQEGIIDLSPSERVDGDLPIVNAYHVVKPFVDIAILLVERPLYTRTLVQYLEIKLPKIKNIEEKS